MARRDNEKSANGRDTLSHPSIVIPRSRYPGSSLLGGRGSGATVARVGCSFAVYTTLGVLRWHFHRTADPTMDHSTPLERGRTIPMLTAFHAKCRGSRHLQSGGRSWMVSQTRCRTHARKYIPAVRTRGPEHTRRARTKPG
ncbi:hypothetical protein PUN28_003259 [Cardiocondyla obscurior]|uniref:Uncharacterized protein n=1 Tax=Cardiocondyla obscurior TaxID=286306 RepID=A0AAW2GI36_9HYME